MIVNQNIFVEKILPGGIMRPLTDAEMDFYRAPYQQIASRKPVWRWPNEIPIAGEPARDNPSKVVPGSLDYEIKITRLRSGF
ncbi:MAG: hypothetical protein AAFX95_11845 [Cyanobacteria bacterium J06639_16]